MIIQRGRSSFSLAGHLVWLVEHFSLNLSEIIIQEMHFMGTDECPGLVEKKIQSSFVLAGLLIDLLSIFARQILSWINEYQWGETVPSVRQQAIWLFWTGVNTFRHDQEIHKKEIHNSISILKVPTPTNPTCDDYVYWFLSILPSLCDDKGDLHECSSL